MVHMSKIRSLVVVGVVGALAIAGCSLPGNGNGLGGSGPAVVNLRTAGNYVILSKAGITTTAVTAITGDIGTSPASAAAIVGFALSMDVSNTFSTSPHVVGGGKVYASDYTDPTPFRMTTAVADMETAYTDAAGRPAAVGANLNMGAGTITGVTLAPGLYTWGTDLNITTDITLSGSANDTWIFQIAGFLALADNAHIVLSGGAQARNITWEIAGTGASFGTSSHFEGTILALKGITYTSGATMNGRALAQTAVTLIGNTLVSP
jgi:Ice-binding-like